MWKGLGVMALWVGLIALRHASATSDEPVDDPPAGAPKPAAAGAAAGAPSGAPPGSLATIRFKNEVGRAFTLVEAHFLLDDADVPVLTDVKPGAEVVVFSGRLRPGRHVAETRLVYRGNRRGPFTYMKDYTITATADETLVVPPETAVQFTISGRQRKGARVPLSRQVEIELDGREIAPRAPTN